MNKDSIDWVEVFRCGTDYEAALVHARLQDEHIPAVILNQRDHAFNLNLGYLSKVKVLVPKSMEKQASDLLDSKPLTDEELAQIALNDRNE
ncbi:MAG: DUF2007 domain-containing protein [Bacteroidetes bacterium]|nr:DUF2007 domain-containing protein [Bacteroidota bacterium]MCY4234055.1 DUF2007 domain-containing protein [Bacteroidota bacterium]